MTDNIKEQNIMPLIACPDCKQQVSDKAKFCIHCGYPLEPVKPAWARDIQDIIAECGRDENKIHEMLKGYSLKVYGDLHYYNDLIELNDIIKGLNDPNYHTMIPIIATCRNCGHHVPLNQQKCPNCGELKRIYCPKCNTVNGHYRISNTTKALAGGLFDLFAVDTIMYEWECRKCGHKFNVE
jgi:ribosomal protein L37E